MSDSFMALPRTDPVMARVLHACTVMPNSRLVQSIPLGELMQFARALDEVADGVPTGKVADEGRQ